MRKLSLEEWKDAAEKINSAEKAVSAIGFNFPKSISNKIVTVLHKLGEIKFDMQFRCSEIEHPEMPLEGNLTGLNRCFFSRSWNSVWNRYGTDIFNTSVPF